MTRTNELQDAAAGNAPRKAWGRLGRTGAWWIEYGPMGLATLVMLALCVIVSSAKRFWFDELLSYYFVTDPSLGHMFRALGERINFNPPLYFVLGQGWARVFGGSELSLRLFSSLAMIAAMWLVWDMLRRVYQAWPANVGTVLFFFASTWIIRQNAEARFYGLFFAEIAAGCWLFGRMATQTRLRWPWLIATAAAHASMLLTHYVGFFFSASLGVAYAVQYARERRFRVGAQTLAAILLGWLTFVPWIPNFLEHGGGGHRPISWMKMPGWMDLVDALRGNIAGFAIITLMLAGVCLLSWIIRKKGLAPQEHEGEQEGEGRAQRSAMLILAASLLLVPIGMWLYSHVRIPIFLPRYMFPSGITWAIVWTHCTWWALRHATGVFRWLAHAVLAVLMLWVVLGSRLLVHVDYQPSAIGVGYPELPVAVENIFTFLSDQFYTQGQRYVYVLDPQLNSRNAGEREMYETAVLLHRYYPQIPVTDLDSFLAAHSEFLVLRGTIGGWSVYRLGGNPAYRLERVPSKEGWIYHVVQVSPEPTEPTTKSK